jgi:hypothetical protein
MLEVGITSGGIKKRTYIDRYAQMNDGMNGMANSAGTYRCNCVALSDVIQFIVG